MADSKPQSFEAALKQLETIVNKLEGENITLEESVKMYEEGVVLSKQCAFILEQAELRIDQVNARQTD